MIILALDLGTSTGWALGRRIDGDLDVLDSGVVNLKGKSHGHRMLELEEFVRSSMYRPGGIDLIVYEDVRRHMGTDAAHLYGAFAAMVQACCITFGIQCESVGVGTIKKRATGKGNAKKNAMIEAAKAKWPDQAIIDDNHADALWLLDCLVSLIEED